jgi:hypothetical protein
LKETLAVADLSLETQGFFPGRGRGWRAWEDEFLKTFSSELGLRVSAEQLRRPPADVALRISWLGLRLPEGKASLAKASPAPKLAKKPQAIAHAKAEAPEGWMTCAKVAELAGCKVGLVYSAIWKKRLDAVQGDRGVWLVPDDAGKEFAEARKANAPKEVPERPVEAKEGGSAVVLRERQKDAPEGPSEAQNGNAENFTPAAPVPDEPPAEARATSPVKGPSPQAMDLGSMSKLDILRAIAAGKLEAADAG